MLIASLGFGNLAKWCMTIPPRVSKSLSLKDELNFSLKTSIGVKQTPETHLWLSLLSEFQYLYHVRLLFHQLSLQEHPQ